MEDDTDAIIRATVQRFRDVAFEHARNQEALDQIYKQVDGLTERQNQLSNLASRCYATAELFGFDLAAELARAPAQLPATTMAEIAAIAEAPTRAASKVPTVKEFILDRARLAFPNPVRAAALRRAFEEVSGRSVHEKTFGMSLYRLSIDGAMKREGAADWYFVPEDQRIPVPVDQVDTSHLF